MHDNSPMKILVVDDEEALHFIVAVWLAKAGGFDLSFASNGDEALRAHAERGPFDVVLTDYVHPGPNGLELAKRLRQKHPQQRMAMFTAGMPDSAVRSCGRLKIPVLWKPCDANALPRLLEALIANGKKKVAKKTVRRREAKKRNK